MSVLMYILHNWCGSSGGQHLWIYTSQAPKPVLERCSSFICLSFAFKREERKRKKRKKDCLYMNNLRCSMHARLLVGNETLQWELLNLFTSCCCWVDLYRNRNPTVLRNPLTCASISLVTAFTGFSYYQFTQSVLYLVLFPRCDQVGLGVVLSNQTIWDLRLLIVWGKCKAVVETVARTAANKATALTFLKRRRLPWKSALPLFSSAGKQTRDVASHFITQRDLCKTLKWMPRATLDFLVPFPLQR